MLASDHFNLKIFGKTNDNYSPSFHKRIEQLKEERQLINNPLSVVILGAGPCGLLRGIQSILQGNKTTILEKREEFDNKRENIVVLSKESNNVLKKYAIYQYLVENSLILKPKPDGWVSVRLLDLEKASKAVINELAVEPIIKYACKVKEIAEEALKAKIVVESKSNEEEVISSIDVIVNAEGSHSSTNALLKIERIQVLEKIPVISAIFKNNTSKVRSICTFFSYIGKSITQLIIKIVRYSQIFFMYIFNKKIVIQKIPGAGLFGTPNQNYLYCGLNKADTEKMLSLKKKKQEHEIALAEAIRINNAMEIANLQKKLKNAKNKLDSFVERLINLTYFSLRFMLKIGKDAGYAERTKFQPFASYNIIQIGLDKAEKFSKKIGNSHVLLAGDALATVNPSTGLGCNSAIMSSYFFEVFMAEKSKGNNIDKALDHYDLQNRTMVDYTHECSKMAQNIFLRNRSEPEIEVNSDLILQIERN